MGSLTFRYPDTFYCLNQDSRPDRWQQASEEFARMGFSNVQRISSIEADQPYQSFCLSQHNLLSTFLKSSGNILLAFEDDVLFKSFENVDKAISELPDDWDILQWGANVLENSGRFSGNLFHYKNGWTTHCVQYSRKVVEWIVENYNPNEFMMYDEWLRVNVLPKFRCFIMSPFAAWQRPVFSDLWGRDVSYGWDEIEKRLI